jgi:perosamine synthetase
MGSGTSRDRFALPGLAAEQRKMLPYGCQSLDEEDVQAVIEVLRSDLLTTGPKISEFERAFAEHVGSREAVAVSSGTAALHAAAYAAGIGPGDEVIVPPITFAATANCVVFQGGTPVFADVDADTLLLDPSQVEARITARTRAIIAVDYAGQPCDYDALMGIAQRHDLVLIDDACHAIGGLWAGRSVGTLADLSTFSFHPVKHFTTGEGGMVCTDDVDLAHRMRIFRNHGIATDHQERARSGSFSYEMVDLGYNYRITDFQCALGLSQLAKLPKFLERRRQIAAVYDQVLDDLAFVRPLAVRPETSHAYHLYVVAFDSDVLGMSRAEVYAALRRENIGVGVHYMPAHLHPFYRKRFGYGPGLCPVAERAYGNIVSLPIFPKMTDDDVACVARELERLPAHGGRIEP